MSQSALECELLRARMKSIQYESTLLHEVVKLQRMRIEQLERRLEVEKQLRRARFHLTEFGVCRNCGLPTRQGQLYCGRACMTEWQRARRGEAVA